MKNAANLANAQTVKIKLIPAIIKHPMVWKEERK